MQTDIKYIKTFIYHTKYDDKPKSVVLPANVLICPICKYTTGVARSLTCPKCKDETHPMYSLTNVYEFTNNKLYVIRDNIRVDALTSFRKPLEVISKHYKYNNINYYAQAYELHDGMKFTFNGKCVTIMNETDHEKIIRNAVRETLNKNIVDAFVNQVDEKDDITIINLNKLAETSLYENFNNLIQVASMIISASQLPFEHFRDFPEYLDICIHVIIKLGKVCAYIPKLTDALNACPQTKLLNIAIIKAIPIEDFVEFAEFTKTYKDYLLSDDNVTKYDLMITFSELFIKVAAKYSN